MKANHPNIILDYIPDGCTSVAQPCDIGIQRPFKLSVKQSYHEDVVNEVTAQLKAKVDMVALDCHLPIMRDQSTHWLWNAYQALNVESLGKRVSSIESNITSHDLLFVSRHLKSVSYGNGISHIPA